MLQEARNLSKPASNTKNMIRKTSKVNMNPLKQTNQEELNYYNTSLGRDTSEIFKPTFSPWTRSKTKILSFDNINNNREDSDINFKPSIFNEYGPSIPIDNFFGMPSNPLISLANNKASYPLFFQSKEASPFESPNFARDQNRFSNFEFKPERSRSKNLRLVSCQSVSKSNAIANKECSQPKSPPNYFAQRTLSKTRGLCTYK